MEAIQQRLLRLVIFSTMQIHAQYQLQILQETDGQEFDGIATAMPQVLK